MFKTQKKKPPGVLASSAKRHVLQANEVRRVQGGQWRPSMGKSRKFLLMGTAAPNFRVHHLPYLCVWGTTSLRIFGLRATKSISANSSNSCKLQRINDFVPTKGIGWRKYIGERWDETDFVFHSRIQESRIHLNGFKWSNSSSPVGWKCVGNPVMRGVSSDRVGLTHAGRRPLEQLPPWCRANSERVNVVFWSHLVRVSKSVARPSALGTSGPIMDQLIGWVGN